MKRMFLAVFAAMFLMAPVAAGVAYAADTSKRPPPIGQTLVREGDYAVKLAQALKVGPAATEADSENALAAIGIAPKSGWISDFPVTPDIIAELQTSIDAAASSGRLAMGKGDAYSAFQALNAQAGLSVTAGASGARITEYNNEDQQGYADAPAYEDQAALDSYYADEGPPVITYYAPPPDYVYLYAWDPFPFWWGGIFFPGFFVLNDFTIFADFDDFGHGHHRFGHRDEWGHDWHNHGMISNHVTDRATNKTVSIDPVSKHARSETSFRGVGDRSSWSESRTTGMHDFARGGSFNRSSASNLVGRSFDRSANTFVERGGVMTRRASNAVVGSGRSWGSSGAQTRSFNGGSRSFNSGSVRSFNGGNRTFNGSSMRSFNGESRSSWGGSARSFSGVSRSSGGGFNSSFGGGGLSRGFSGGGGGHSSGGGLSRGGGGWGRGR